MPAQLHIGMANLNTNNIVSSSVDSTFLAWDQACCPLCSHSTRYALSTSSPSAHPYQYSGSWVSLCGVSEEWRGKGIHEEESFEAALEVDASHRCLRRMRSSMRFMLVQWAFANGVRNSNMVYAFFVWFSWWLFVWDLFSAFCWLIVGLIWILGLFDLVVLTFSLEICCLGRFCF